MTEIPLVDLKAQYAALRFEIDVALSRVLDHAEFILGREVSTFESAFARYTGTADCVGVASGTAALKLALLALGVGPGDEVVTAAHTFIATAEAISLVGARPVFADIDEETFTLDPTSVERALTSRTRALIPVHLYGQPVDMDPLLEIARSRNLAVIEDAAQAHGAEYRGRRCGSIGRLACFSFYPGKNLGAYGDAGAVTGNDPVLLDRVRKLRDHGRSSKYEHEVIGHAERMDALQAAVLAVKLRRLDGWTEARRVAASLYSDLLSGIPVEVPREPAYARSVYHLFVIRVRKRDAVLDGLRHRGIGAGVHYPVPLHRQPAYQALGYGSLSLPRTEEAAAEVLSLPIYPEITPDQIGRVVQALRECLR